MAKIPRVKVFNAVVEATERDDYDSADRIMEIVMRSLMKDKRDKTFSMEFELRNETEIGLFDVEDIIFL